MTYPPRITATYYGAAAKQLEEVKTSSSGGIASVFARAIIRDGGCVFGAAYDTFPDVKHICVDSENDVVRLKGSKYVESDIKNALKCAKSRLDVGKNVLFVGLPCQIAALYGILGGDRANLVTVDLICHGKPPQKLFSLWVSELEKKFGMRVVDYWFRNKFNCAWNNPGTFLHYCKLEDGRIVPVPREWNWYARYFLGNVSFMDGCYRCPFAKLPRIADITIGDFWGGEQNPELSSLSANGISLVSVQSGKGMKLVERTTSDAVYVPVKPEFALMSNRQLTHASVRPIYRNFVFGYVYRSAFTRKCCDVILFGTGALIRKLFKWRQ